MNGNGNISRRAFVGGSLLAALPENVLAQGFAGLGGDSQGYASVVPGIVLEFPRDHGPHSDFRIEWWYLTANLQDASGAQYGAQWTLFRQAATPAADMEGWNSRQLWMGHAAVTSATKHYFTERLARGGVGQANVIASPFSAWIDSWEMRASEPFSPRDISPLNVAAIGPDFNFEFQLNSEKPLVLQGEGGYSRKSDSGQASYYFSQPFFLVSGQLTLNDRNILVSGRAWMDREWSSQPLALNQTGWDWFSLHLESGEKIMLFRLRQKDGNDYFAGNWITHDGASTPIAPANITMKPAAFTNIDGRKLPTSWSLEVIDRNFKIESKPLNPNSWMGTRFSYWEGPISFTGTHQGVGYLEMTGYQRT